MTVRRACLQTAVWLIACGCHADTPRPADAPQWIRMADSVRAELRLANGTVVTFVDDTTRGDMRLRHSYDGAVPGTDFVGVAASYYESWEYRLVHAGTGRVTSVVRPPVVSPDRRRLLVVSGLLEAGDHIPNVLQVWRVVGDTLHLEWELEPADYAIGEGWAASAPRWVSDSVAVAYRRWLVRGVPASDSSMVWIVRRGAAWSVEDRPPDA